MLNVLVTGSNGQLGSEIKFLSTQFRDYNFTFVDRSRLDFALPESIQRFFQDKSFDVIINCAAYTVVDKAESEVDLAMTVNALAVEVLAQVAHERNIKLIHVSTDYVFDGKNFRPYVESDSVNPAGVYGKSKAGGEKAIVSIAPANTVIIRTSWVYSNFGNNFVKTMLRLGSERDSLNVVFDQVGSPTYARDLASVILEIVPKINNQKPEIYHFSNEGVISWFDFAKAIFEVSDIKSNVSPIVSEQYPTPAKRPHYSVLNKAKIKKDFNINIPYWKDSLRECLKLLKENK